jgi:Uri superfamily endonuclease
MHNKGTYCLLLSCEKDLEIEVGKLGVKRFDPGYYLYIGSALKNMDKRIGRHLRRKKKKFWHIDYLTSEMSFNIEKVYTIDRPERLECARAKDMEKMLDPVTGFGSSDCRCKSHLLFTGGQRDVPDIEKDLVIKSGFEEYNNKRTV